MTNPRRPQPHPRVAVRGRRDRGPLREWTRQPLRGLGTGTAYGFGLWLVVAQGIVPFLTPMLGYGAAPAFPYPSPVALVGYLGFGALVGLTYAVGVRAPSATADSVPSG